MKNTIRPVVAMAAALLFAGSVWPTVWSNEGIVKRGDREYAVRVHRFTGETQVLTPKGWRSTTPSSDPSILSEKTKAILAGQ